MFVLLLAAILVATFLLGKSTIRSRSAETGMRPVSHANYYGYYLSLATVLPSAILISLWMLLQPLALRGFVLTTVGDLGDSVDSRVFYTQVENVALGVLNEANVSDVVIKAAATFNRLSYGSNILGWAGLICSLLSGFIIAWRNIVPTFRARVEVEKIFRGVLFVSATVAVLTTIGIIASLFFESMKFFSKTSIFDFLFGLHWSPQTAIRPDQVASSGSFGAVPLFAGTLLISIVAMCVAIPIGLFSAIYLSEYASKNIRTFAKPLLEILAGIPTVVYGFFAAMTVAPWIVDFADFIGMTASSESALAAGLVMGVMIIPFISSLSDDVINAVPQTLRDASYAVGATKSETVKNVILPAALPGIVGAFLLGFSRAIGETMIVVMAAGLAANLTANPFEAVTTVTVQIVTTLVGDQEFESARTLSAFALGLLLFLVTLMFNVIASGAVKKYREQYE